MNKIIAIVIQIFFISVVCAEKTVLKHYLVMPEKLNIRLEPNKKANVIGFLYKYQKINILEVREGWAKIYQCNNLINKNINTCWVSINYLFPILAQQLKTEPKVVKQQHKIFSQKKFIILLIFVILCLLLYVILRKKTVGSLKNIDEDKFVRSKTPDIVDELLSQILEIKNQLNALQNYSLESKEKIRRFEDGYDWKIQKEFVIDIISTIEYLEKQNKKINNNNLETAIEDLNIILENNSIYKTEINADNYKGQEIMVKVSSTELTNDVSKNDAIKEILKDGYYIEINEMKKVIKPAEVVIYKIKEK